MLTGALRQLFALAEAYPDLKANQNFLQLQEELTSTEDRIAYARQFYNDSVMKYDNKIQSFPSNIIAGHVQLQAARVLPGRAGRDRGAQGPVLSAAVLPRSRRDRRASIPRFSLYEQIAANKRKTVLLIFVFVVLLFAGRRSRSTSC